MSSKYDWSIWVDVEGFSYLSLADRGSDAHWRLHHLMDDVYRFCALSNTDGDRLFAHQFGDGFLISSSDHESPRPILLGVTLLLSSMAYRESPLKVAIAPGGSADVSALFPESVQSAAREGSSFDVGFSKMSVNRVMGDGLVNAHNLSKKEHGPVLLIDSKYETELNDLQIPQAKAGGYILVDWLHYTDSRVDEMFAALRNGHTTSTAGLRQLLTGYIEKHRGMSQEWVGSAEKLIDGY